MSTAAVINQAAGLPANIEAEKTILGAILMGHTTAWSEVSEKLTAADFALDSHQRVFQRMADLFEQQRKIDIVTLAEELSKYKELEAIGGRAYLASLSEGLPWQLALDEYIQIVRDKSILRRVMEICTQGTMRAADQSEEAIDVLAQIEGQLLEVGKSVFRSGFAPIDQIILDSFGSVDKMYERGAVLNGIPTGFMELDAMTSGLQRGDLIIIAARPSMGKTALAINIAQHAAVQKKLKVGVFSLEMSKESLLRRMHASEAWINHKSLQNGFLRQEDKAALDAAIARLVESALQIDDSGTVSIAEMRAKARRLKRKLGGLDLIVVDYLQLVSGTPHGRKGWFENRTQEVSAVTRGLKALAKELDVPVIALSQLSRATEKRGEEKRPLLSDLRESGSIEQDADVVMFIYREAYYNKDEEMTEQERAKSEIIVAKQRNGPTGTVYLNFIAAVTAFRDPAYQAE